jgi:hippurate hydrolase
VLARADMDALPVPEATGLPYASTAVATDSAGRETPVMHACGHDMHITCLLATAQLLAEHQQAWSGTFIALFQPAEELGTGARAMVENGLAEVIPRPDVALGQHVMGLPHDTVASRPGAALSAADSIRITLHGRGTHGSMPHFGIDPVLLGSAVVLRLNAIVSRELPPGHFGVVTVGSFQSGRKSNVIPETATLLLNLRAYDDRTRQQLREAIERIVRAECEASGSPAPPEFEYMDPFPVTQNSPDVYEKVSAAFTEQFGDKAILMEPSTGSEDFSDIPSALGAPYLFWIWGGFDPDTYHRAEADGTLGKVIPGNHASTFAPVMEPTFRTGTSAMTVALLSYLARPS